MLIIVISAIIIALAFDFLNGMNDAANSIATVVATKVLSPVTAVCWAAFWNFAAVFIFGVSVATTIGKDVVDPGIVNEYVIFSALIGATAWVWICTHLGFPISVSHALIGGLIGPVWFVYGSEYLIGTGIFKIASFIVLSPLIGLILGFFIMCITMFVWRRTVPLKVDHIFRKLQLVSSAVFSLGHGANDAQKTMGVIAILLFSVRGNSFVDNYLYDFSMGFHIPTWLIFTCYGTIALGTLIGGQKVIKTLGDGLARLKPVQGFCAETAGAITLIGTALSGIPVSTTHTVTGAIVGVGMTKGIHKVKWGTATKIVWAWVLTIPASLILSGLIYLGIFYFIK